MDKALLGVTISLSAIVFGIFAYLKFIKKKIRRFVLRNQKIEKYFQKR